MAESDRPGDTTQFLQKMDGQLLGWEHPAARLREALDFDQFRLYAQPVVSLAPPEGVVMAEVLVRMREEEARMLPPGDFLPAFELYGMMAELDRWVVRNALRTLGRGRGVDKLTVNVSGRTVEEPGFAPFVAMQLRLASIDPGAFVIEIDENDAIDRRQAVERFAAEMKGIGCPLMLDGFARRSVSFELPQTLRVDYVKVDGTIVRNILRSASAAAKLKAIVRVGELTGFGVVAECVEEEAILANLKLLKVGYAQGFGVHKPAPIEELFRS